MLSGIKPSDPEADTLKRIGDNASDFREKAGDIARQLAFAGLATIWIFKSDQTVAALLPIELVRPGALLILALALDLLEYIAGTFIWGLRPSRILKAHDQPGRW